MDPLLLDIPDVLETPRLTLRSPRAGDGPEVNRAILESLESLRPWMHWARHAPAVEDTEARSRRAAAKFILREDMQYRCYLKGTTTLVASIGLHNADWAVPRFEIGYWTRTGFTRQGYATEAVRALADLALGKLQARRLEIRCADRNIASRRVAERAGFTLEAVLRNWEIDPTGKLSDERIYVRLANHPADSPPAP